MKLQFGAADVRLISDELAFDGYFSVRRLTLSHALFGGGWSEPLTRELFERGDAVGVLPYDPIRDELVMLEQFRIGALADSKTPWMLELVAGIVEARESDETVARREAIEEAALNLDTLHPIASFYPSAGACSEKVRLFVGRVNGPAQPGIHGCAEEGEDIRVHVLPRTRVLQWLDEGRIVNGHTLIALQWLQLHGEALRKDWQ
jgi:ADP-ribose pyrophosphatase